MNEEQFKKSYGKIKYKDSIIERHPVYGIAVNDINRSLMIKFKYSNISSDEEFKFHEAIKKIIYRVMHKNNVMMDWEDVYQEIWKKIIRCKHTWKEWKGTMVSTWITIVANSVINTLRQNVNKYNSRYCLYDDLMTQQDAELDESSQEKFDIVAYSSNEEALEDNGIRKMFINEQISEFISTLNKDELQVYNAMLMMQDSILDAYDNHSKIPLNELRRMTGYDESTFSIIIYNIRRKYCDVFDKKFVEHYSDNEDSMEYLF